MDDTDEIESDHLDIVDKMIEDNDPQHLWDAISSENHAVIEVLMQNHFLTDDVIRAKNSFGCDALLLAAQYGNKPLCEYLLQQGVSTEEVDHKGNTAIHWAVMKSDNWELVDYLLLNHARTEDINHEGYTALHLACSVGFIGCVQSLVAQGARLTAVTKEEKLTPLHLACLNGHVSIVDYLVNTITSEAESEQEKLQLLTFTDTTGRTPLHAAAFTPSKATNAYSNTTTTTAQGPSVSSVEHLLNAGVPVDPLDHSGRSPLLWALSGRNTRDALLLIERQANITTTDQQGRGVGHYAAYYHDVEALTHLVRHPAFAINQTDHHGSSVLQAGIGDVGVVKFLLQHHADIDHRDHMQRQAIHYALMGAHSHSFLTLTDAKPLTAEQVNQVDGSGHSLIHYCAKTGSTQAPSPANKACLQVLLDAGVDLALKDPSAHNFIHFAGNFGNFEMIDTVFQIARKHRLSSFVTAANVAGQKPLHFAGARGNAKTCDILMENRAPSWAPDRYGCTALHYAAYFGNMGSMATLMKYQDVQRTDKCGAKAIHFAALSGKIPVCEALLTVGANLNDVDHQGRPVIFYASNEAMLNYLISKGQDMHQTDRKSRSILFNTLQLGLFEFFKVLVEKYQANIHVQDDQAVTLLHQAAYTNQIDFLHYLVENKVNLTARDKYKRSALYYAAARGHEQALTFLLEQEGGVLIDQRDAKGRTVIDAAAFGNHTACVQRIIQSVTDPSQFAHSLAQDGRTALHAAVNTLNDAENGELLRVLLEDGGLDVNAQDMHGRTALHRTVHRNMPHFTRYLLEHGADVNLCDHRGVSPLMIATLMNHQGVLQILEEFSPDVTLRDLRGLSVEEYRKKREELDRYEEEEDEEDYDYDSEPSPDVSSSSIRSITQTDDDMDDEDTENEEDEDNENEEGDNDNEDGESDEDENDDHDEHEKDNSHDDDDDDDDDQEPGDGNSNEKDDANSTNDGDDENNTMDEETKHTQDESPSTTSDGNKGASSRSSVDHHTDTENDDDDDDDLECSSDGNSSNSGGGGDGGDGVGVGVDSVEEDVSVRVSTDTTAAATSSGETIHDFNHREAYAPSSIWPNNDNTTATSSYNIHDNKHNNNDDDNNNNLVFSLEPYNFNAHNNNTTTITNSNTLHNTTTNTSTTTNMTKQPENRLFTPTRLMCFAFLPIAMSFLWYTFASSS